VSGEDGEGERILPLDLIPRVIAADAWTGLEAGLIQRVRALNAFLADVYGRRQVLRDRVVPPWLVLGSPGYQRAAWGLRPPLGVHVHVAGPDLVRGHDRGWLVLEDNLRVPSGVSYALENREILSRALPELFDAVAIRPVAHYPAMLLQALRACAPEGAGDQPTVVLHTAGVFNAAYFEHVLLARHMGVDLVEGDDLFVDGARVFMRTTLGRRRVDVIYRRVDEDYLDPLSFRADSLLGVAGLVNAVRAGHVTIANAIGNGVADDKAVYRYVPELVRYHLGEEPLLGQVPTLLCGDPADLAEVLDRLGELVVKPVDGSGGHGLVIGPNATRGELEALRRRILAQPRGYIAQELIALSRHPTFLGDRLHARHVDLRPFIVQGDRTFVLPGGLTRVALPAGSMVVNSSQGGGSKDTWVLRSPNAGGRNGVAEVARTAWLPMMNLPERDTGQRWQPMQQHQEERGC
jgi:uncharacterized circularly permuted ATP-grasp superfamily protein